MSNDQVQTYIKYDVGVVKRAVSLPDLMVRFLQVEFEREGKIFRCLCPFHSERTPSFKIEEGPEGWWYNCFGCGAKGDALSFWMAHKGYGKADFRQALQELAQIAGIAGDVTEKAPKPAKPKVPVPEIRKELQTEREKLPPVRPLSRATCEELAKIRGITPDGVWAAARQGLVWGQMLGVSAHGEIMWGEKMMREGDRRGLRIGPVRCWLVTDGEGFVSQARRLDLDADGKPMQWMRHNGQSFKSWTIGTSKWPIGAAQIGDRKKVCLIEGGPDMLAAHDILLRVHGPEVFADYAVVGVLGAGVHMREDAARYFSGKHVRIFADADDEKELKNGRKTKVGWDGAYKWQEWLTDAGATVDVANLEGLTRADGEPVKDVNDLARSTEEWLAGDECRELWTI